MPRVPSKPVTAEARLAKRRSQAAECEMLARRSFRSQAEARMAVFDISKASTTRGAVTRRSTTNHRWSMRGVTRSPRER
jgi:hypothetical protein